MQREASKEVSKKIVHCDSESIKIRRLARFPVWNRYFFYFERETEEWKDIWPDLCRICAMLHTSPWFFVAKTKTFWLWHEARPRLVRDKWSETFVVRNTWILYKIFMQTLWRKISQQKLTTYLVAINLHNWCPSTISTSKISHLTENGSCFRAKV